MNANFRNRFYPALVVALGGIALISAAAFAQSTDQTTGAEELLNTTWERVRAVPEFRYSFEERKVVPYPSTFSVFHEFKLKKSGDSYTFSNFTSTFTGSHQATFDPQRIGAKASLVVTENSEERLSVRFCTDGKGHFVSPEANHIGLFPLNEEIYTTPDTQEGAAHLPEISPEFREFRADCIEFNLEGEASDTTVELVAYRNAQEIYRATYTKKESL